MHVRRRGSGSAAHRGRFGNFVQDEALDGLQARWCARVALQASAAGERGAGTRRVSRRVHAPSRQLARLPRAQRSETQSQVLTRITCLSDVEDGADLGVHIRGSEVASPSGGRTPARAHEGYTIVTSRAQCGTEHHRCVHAMRACRVFGGRRTSENCSKNAALYLSTSTPSSFLRSSTTSLCGVPDCGTTTCTAAVTLVHAAALALYAPSSGERQPHG